MGTGHIHASVLLEEAIRHLSPRDGGRYIDVTCGLGGHSEAILDACGPTGRLLAVDRDPQAIELAKGRLARFGDRVTIVEGNFSDLRTFAEASDVFPADGLIADLGVSSLQLDDAKRGFSFMREGPLDMRMGPVVGPTAGELIERFERDELMRLLRDFGEVNRPRQIADAIIDARDRGELVSTSVLASVIEKASGGRKASPIHPATRAFQAIRIATNRELEELEKLLAALPDLIAPGGRVCVITFHSLEDRMVKRAFDEPEQPVMPRGLPVEPEKKLGPWKQVTKKPLTPSSAELKDNPRSRSAKLRVAERRVEAK
ncbi:16S rRNA (cytosine(1402)-N(4))-methyltransferase RsmH [Myxococcota bacterium]|nr:16S rRNA (cytosine(1402)-N(4))-methyltransferase RsmH [Myxococcota bacterium]